MKNNISIISRAETAVDKRFGLYIGLVLLIAIVARVIALLSFKNSLYYDFLLFDEQVYHQWATKIASGDFGNLNVYDFAPLPAYIMAGIYRLFSPDILYIRMMNMVFGTATCLLIIFIGRRLNGSLVGIIGGMVAALYEPMIFFSVVLHKTALSVLLFAAFVYVVLVLLDQVKQTGQHSAGRLLFIGLLAGLLAALLMNVRSNGIVIMPIVLVGVIWTGYRRNMGRQSLQSGTLVVCAFFLGWAITITPFVIRDYKSTGEIAVTPAGGFNLYIANNPDNPFPYYRPVQFATSNAAEQAIGFTIEASRRAGRKLTPQEASSFWTREVMRYALDSPGEFSRKMIIKILAVFNQYESADNHHLEFLKPYISFLRLPFIPFWFILPLGMAGLLMTGFQRRKHIVVVLIFAAYTFTMIVFFSNIRIRLPMLVIWIPFAIMGLLYFASRMGQQRYVPAAAYLLLTVLFYVIAFLPLPGVTDTTGYLNTHALNLDLKGREKAAMALWEQSAAMNYPYSAFAHLSLAGKYADKGRVEKALAHIHQIPDSSLAASLKYSALGDMAAQQNNIPAAIDAYKKSLEINYGQRQVWMKLFHLYWDRDKALADEAYDHFQYISSFYGAMQ